MINYTKLYIKIKIKDKNVEKKFKILKVIK